MSYSSITIFHVSFVTRLFSLALSHIPSFLPLITHQSTIVTRHLSLDSSIVNHHSSTAILAIRLSSILNQRLSKQRKPPSSLTTHLHIYKERVRTASRVCPVAYLRRDVLAPIRKQEASMTNLSLSPALSGIRLVPPLLQRRLCGSSLCHPKSSRH